MHAHLGDLGEAEACTRTLATLARRKHERAPWRPWRELSSSFRGFNQICFYLALNSPPPYNFFGFVRFYSYKSPGFVRVYSYLLLYIVVPMHAHLGDLGEAEACTCTLAALARRKHARAPWRPWLGGSMHAHLGDLGEAEA